MKQIIFCAILISLFVGCSHGIRKVQSTSDESCRDYKSSDGFVEGTEFSVTKTVLVSHDLSVPAYSVAMYILSPDKSWSCAVSTLLEAKEFISITPENTFTIIGRMEGRVNPVFTVRSNSNRRYEMTCGKISNERNESLYTGVKVNFPTQFCQGYNLIPATYKQSDQTPNVAPIEL